ncbi:hypothetical protein CEXT_133641 [Caerostris extrusa]|uniref:Uncharacterized protein n=1 Tax=Caerostris extrusa TaxID=172846 RepID=A0AAV4SJZ0_CAEEX|nr:hypothetical protein CEXT_133641 [Caerostris extrusa]
MNKLYQIRIRKNKLRLWRRRSLNVLPSVTRPVRKKDLSVHGELFPPRFLEINLESFQELVWMWWPYFDLKSIKGGDSSPDRGWTWFGGKEVAFRLAELGPVLVLWDINQENNETVANKLKAAGHTVFSYKVDVTNEQEVIQVANRVKQEVGDVSILINNVRGLLRSTTGQSSQPYHQKVLRNSTAVFLPRMIELNRGHVIAVALLQDTKECHI